MPPDLTGTSSIAGLASNFGFAGIIFVIWLFDMRKQDKLQKVIEDQVADKQTMRDDRNKMIDIITTNAALQERTNDILRRIEKKL